MSIKDRATPLIISVLADIDKKSPSALLSHPHEGFSCVGRCIHDVCGTDPNKDAFPLDVHCIRQNAYKWSHLNNSSSPKMGVKIADEKTVFLNAQNGKVNNGEN